MATRLTRLEPQIRTLIYYIQRAFNAAGKPLDGECRSELESVREAFEAFDEERKT